MTKPELLRAWIKSIDEATNHPPATVIEKYCLHPDELDQETIKNFEDHLAHCERCARQVHEGKERADYYRRLEGKTCD